LNRSIRPSAEYLISKTHLVDTTGANDAMNEDDSISTAGAEGATAGENGVDETEVENGSIQDEGGQNSDLSNQRPEISIPDI
jgi:hypothetical protein